MNHKILLLFIFQIPLMLSAQLKEWAIEPQFDDIKRANENISIVKKQDKWGIVDYSGKILLPPQYDSIAYLSEHYALIIQNKQQGVYYYNEQRLCVPVQYDRIITTGMSKTAVCVVEKNGLRGLIDINNREIVPTRYKTEVFSGYKSGNQVWYVKDAVNKNDTIYVDSQKAQAPGWYQLSAYVFKQLPSPLPKDLNPRSRRPERSFDLLIHKQEMVIEQKQQVAAAIPTAIISVDVDNIPPPPMEPQASIGRAEQPREPIKRIFYRNFIEDDKIQLLDSDKKPLFDEHFHSISKFGNRFLMLQKERDGKYALWDTQTKQFETDYIYTTIMLYTPSKLYLYKRDGKAGFINDDGEEVMPLKYDDGYIHMNFVTVHKDSKIGLMNCNNELFLPVEYDQISFVDNEKGAWVSKNGKLGLMRFFW